MNLPDLEEYQGDWQDFIDMIHEVYLETINNSDLRFNNLPVRPRYSPVTHGKHYGFWHLTSTGKIEEDRLPDLERCKRIRWVQYLIKNYKQFDWWFEKRGRDQEVVIWCEVEQFVVILSERRDYWLLKTAYLATKRYKIAQLIRSRDKFSQPRKN